MTRPVVVLGDLNVDLTLELPDRAAPAPERVVREPRLTGGGTAGNAAAALGCVYGGATVCAWYSTKWFSTRRTP